MKRVVFLSIMAIVAIFLVGFSACNPKNKKQEKVEHENTSVEQLVSIDREYMYMNYGSDYRWYETCILLKNYLDADGQDGSIERVTNVFQTITEKDGGADTYVVQVSHVDGKGGVDIIRGFWIEDFVLNDQLINITFIEAYNRIMATNYPKPHSRQCVLRKQVGPKVANPQFIFGNTKAQLYVDAVTGEVTDTNPAFDRLGAPLGEWP